MTSSHLLNKETISNVDTSLTNTDLSNLSNTGESHFQTPLVSGNNIKTINSTSLLGSGDIIISAGAPTGSIMIWAGTTVPEGYLLCDGSAVSRTTYSALFSAIGTTYGAGDSRTTFNLPNFNERYLKGFGANTSPVGTYGTQTLPNITGGIQRISTGSVTGTFSGAFSEITNWGNNNLSSSGIPNYIQQVSFDASKSNSVYGNYNVNPYNVIMMVCIKY